MKFYYLASPYTHSDHTIRDERAAEVRAYAAKFLSIGIIVFSPIAMTHEMAKEHALPTNFEFWDKFNQSFIDASCGVIVAEIEGWSQSKGVAHEIAIANKMNLPVSHAFLASDGTFTWSVTL